MACLISDWSSWIQAGAAVGIVISRHGHLKYCVITPLTQRRLLKPELSRSHILSCKIENSQMPFLALVFNGNDGWLIRNEGFGPAINIQHSTVNGNERGTRVTTPLGAGDIEHMHNLVSALFARWQQFDMEYESLSGKRYRTIVRLEDGQTRTQFQRLE